MVYFLILLFMSKIMLSVIELVSYCFKNGKIVN